MLCPKSTWDWSRVAGTTTNRPELSQMLQRPADVLAFAAANPQIPAEDHQRLRTWLAAWGL